MTGTTGSSAGRGTDVLKGGDGDDTVVGGDDGYGDYLGGGKGDDTIISGAGGDFLIGGEGADTYVISAGYGNDTISGFSEEDVIVFQSDTFGQTDSFEDLEIEFLGDDVAIHMPDGDRVLLWDVAGEDGFIGSAQDLQQFIQFTEPELSI